MAGLIIFVVYLVLLVGIGVITYLKTKSYDDYSLAGRGNNKWITAISAESSDMSGWLLLGLPGMAFSIGFGVIWVLIGILFGTLFNWVVVANRLRTITEHYKVVALTDFFEKRLSDKKGIISLLSAIIIIVFMVINSSAEIIGSGKLLNAAFGFDYNIGIIIGAIIVLVYTFLGGYMAVSWSNLIQGSIMFLALIIIPLVVLFNIGGLTHLFQNLSQQDTGLFTFLGGTQGFWPSLALILGGIGIGIGYPGQPHVLTSFMSIKNPTEIKDSTLIAMLWVGITTYGAAVVGLIGRALYPDTPDPEKIFLLLTKDFFPSYAIGIFAAAVMAAILSSVSAYMLVAAASFASNIYTRYTKAKDDSQLVWVGRIAIIIFTLFSLAMSFSGGLVFKIALYAWGGLAACFVPLVLFSLYWPGLNKKGAVWSMIVGMFTILAWYNLGLSTYIYELIPALLFSTITAYAISNATGGPDLETRRNFESYISTIKKTQSIQRKNINQ